MITKYLKKHMVAAVACLGIGTALTSCNDFLTIYPTDRIVKEDFWKTKSHVDQMVDGAFQSMLDYSIQERFIMWGAYRSDELTKYSAYNDNTLDNIEGVNLLPSQHYNSWAAFYKVINNCNIVLHHAPDVLQEDPEFTQGDYEVVKAQMLALRSLCYFYLVRAFRDVPYTTTAVENDSQIENLPQTSPDEVLQHCLDDLAAAEPYVMRTGAYGDWRDWGYMTRDAVHALMADIYLWRASMTHNKNDYHQVIDYVDMVIKAKDKYYRENYKRSVTDEEDDSLHLAKNIEAFITLFNNNYMNAHESILELQFNGINNTNRALENYYYQSGESEEKHKTTSILMASSLFSSPKKDASKIYLSANDYRFWNNVYGANSEEAEQMSIRKMVDNNEIIVSPNSATGISKSNSRQFKEFRQNWIIYRLTDLMLMKAEALVETAKDSTDVETLKQAFELVKAVNDRSMTVSASDLLSFEDYQNMSLMEQLVLEERERELCFEGKRWFDLMRYSYRHMKGVNISQKLSDTNAWPALYTPMLKLVARKYSSGGDAVTYKMKSEPYLYWPVLESELKVNSLLKQNPVYTQEETISKN